jgi:hypothetical protein
MGIKPPRVHGPLILYALYMHLICILYALLYAFYMYFICIVSAFYIHVICMLVKNPLRMLEKCDGKMGYLRVLLVSERRATAAGTKVSSDLVKSGVADIKDRVLLRKVCQVCT